MRTTVTIDEMSFPLNIEPGKRGTVATVGLDGMGVGLEAFIPLMTELGELGSSKIMFDFPPHWRWSVNWIFFPMNDIAHVVARLMTELGHEQFDIIGVSWGGILAIQLAALYPERVRKVVLISTTARPFPHFLKRSTIQAYVNAEYGGELRDNAQLRNEIYSLKRSPETTNGYRIYALCRWLGLLLLPRVTQPTLIISGDDDPFVPQGEVHWLKNNIANSQATFVSGGHFVIVTRKNEIAQFVLPFLSNNS